MVKEEALKTLKENLCSMCAYGSQCMESCDIRYCDNRDAIESLSAEHCEDTISRADTIEWLKRVTVTDGITFETGFKQILTDIQNMPPVTPKQKIGRWISVSERLPEDGTWNIFTDGKKVSIERYKSDALDHFYPNGRWFSLEEVVAWMPLPERYKTEREDKNENK